MSETPPPGAGVYFLIRSGTIVYIGSSRWPSKRVWSHARCRKTRKVFDQAVYLPVGDPMQLLPTERSLIACIRPVYNQAANPNPSPWAGGWG